MAESSGSTDWQSLADTLNSNHIPELVLLLVGIVALFVVYMYLKDNDSPGYKLAVTIGVLIGIIMVAICVIAKAGTGTTIIIAIACFALIIRPFRDVHFAVILALLVMVIVYLLLGQITQEPFDALNHGWPRIIVAFVAGSIVYMMLNFLQALVLGAAKVLNAWPILGILGIICIVEAVCWFQGYPSVYDMILSFVKDKTPSEIFLKL